MNNKQKLGYMALGAGILAVGIMIGQFVTPDIEAQSNGVFHTITCRLLKVVDNEGNTAIGLTGDTVGSGIYILDTSGNEAISLTHTPRSDQNAIVISDTADKMSFRFSAYRDRNELVVCDKSSGAGIGFYGDANEAKQTRWSGDYSEFKK